MTLLSVIHGTISRYMLILGIGSRDRLNRGVPKVRSIKTTGGNFSLGLNPNGSHIQLTRCSGLTPVQKKWGKSMMTASYFCILPSVWFERLYFSLQEKLYGIKVHHCSEIRIDDSS